MSRRRMDYTVDVVAGCWELSTWQAQSATHFWKNPLHEMKCTWVDDSLWALGEQAVITYSLDHGSVAQASMQLQDTASTSIR